MGSKLCRVESDVMMCAHAPSQTYGDVLLAPYGQSIQGISVSTVGSSSALRTQTPAINSGVRGATVAAFTEHLGEPSLDIKPFGNGISGIPPRRQSGTRRV